MAQSIDDVPFDLRHRRVLLYEYSPPGLQEAGEDTEGKPGRHDRETGVTHPRPAGRSNNTLQRTAARASWCVGVSRLKPTRNTSMSDNLRVFLSSTFSDLKEYRTAAVSTLQRFGFVPVTFETLGTIDEAPAAASAR